MMASNIMIKIVLLSLAMCGPKLNIAYNLSCYSTILQGFGYVIDAYLNYSIYPITQGGFLNKIYTNSSFLYFQDSSVSISDIKANTCQAKLSLQPVGICTGMCSIKYFGISNKTYSNLIFMNQGKPLSLSFQMEIDYTNSTMSAKIASNVSIAYPDSISMFMISDEYPYSPVYFSKWISLTGSKVLNQIIKLTQTDIINATKFAFSSSTQSFPSNISFGLFIIDTTIISQPVINQSIFMGFNGSIYSPGVQCSNIQQTVVPNFENSIKEKQFQYLIDQSMLQDQLNTVTALQGFSFDDSYIFTDLTIYNITCNSNNSPQLTISKGNATIAYNGSCQVYTDVYKNFNITFISAALMNITSPNDRYGVNSVQMEIKYANLTSLLFNGNVNNSYSLFVNHFSSVLSSMSVMISETLGSIPLPTPNNYVLNKPATYYFNGYAVIAE